MARRAMTVCNVPGCPEYTRSGRCPEHERAAERRRGKTAQRGYSGQHVRRFRRGVLDRDVLCVVCRSAPASEADHWPKDRRQLEAEGLDPNDPQYGRGTCKPCHSSETARYQPGGWANQA